ncbi:restriction endonuclease subunit S [Pseudomonas piscis]|uniref:Type I restriction modification DNA specificity domain-containing protein n=1 Tax=Pseudomonas piscis TaxID=2614538 RepID=A0A7X1PH96_9PSED|nr:restriction endonuclease subunit S [Pseudomonas piscis]MQA51702.1 hypothetical protein [Pseudomonas piscis]
MSTAGKLGYQKSKSVRTPQGWTETTLGKVVDFRGGNAFKEKFQGKDSGDFPFIKVSDFNLLANQKFIRDANHWIDAGANKEIKATLFEAGSVVFAKVGAALLSNRRRILTRKTAIDNNLMAAIPRHIDPIFCYYHLQTVDLGKMVQDGAVPSVNQGQLQSLPFVQPSLPEQQKIAAILTAVDDKLDVIARQIEGTLTLKQGLMQTLFSRGMGTQDVTGRWIPHTEFKDSELGAIPTRWSVKEIGEALSIVERPIKMADDQLYRRVTVRRRHAGVDLRDELAGADIKVKNQYLLEAGDFLISERQIVHGACGIVPEHLAGALVSNEYLVLQAKEGFDVTFFNYLVQLLKYAKLFLVCSQGVDIEKFLFKPKDWLKKRIPLPPLAEQQRIAEILASIEEKTNALRRKQSEYQNLKRGLMQKLLTGEWRVKLDRPTGTA